MRIGDVDLGARVVQRIVVNVPRSVRSLSITEAGTLRTINGTLQGFLETQKVAW